MPPSTPKPHGPNLCRCSQAPGCAQTTWRPGPSRRHHSDLQRIMPHVRLGRPRPRDSLCGPGSPGFRASGRARDRLGEKPPPPNCSMRICTSPGKYSLIFLLVTARLLHHDRSDRRESDGEGAGPGLATSAENSPLFYQPSWRFALQPTAALVRALRGSAGLRPPDPARVNNDNKRAGSPARDSCLAPTHRNRGQGLAGSGGAGRVGARRGPRSYLPPPSGK